MIAADDLSRPAVVALRVLTRPRATLRRCAALAEAPPWRRTFLRLTLPLLIASVLVSQALYQVIPTGLPPEAMPDALGFGIYSAVTMAVGVLALALSAHLLTQLFQGFSDFDRSLLAATLGLVPAWVGNIAAAFPWPWGNGIALILIALSLVLLYHALVHLLGLRPGNRAGLFAATLFCGLFLTVVFGWLFIDWIPGAKPEVRLGTTWLI